MPEAGVTQELTTYELKSLEGAFVKIRQLPYYDMLVRRDKGSVASMESQVGGKRKRNQPQTAKMTIESLQTWEREYMFRECIADHNLTIGGVPVDFNTPMALRNLRPDIGMEIEKYIDEVNGDTPEDMEDFQNAASKSTEQPEPVQLIPPSTDSN